MQMRRTRRKMRFDRRVMGGRRHDYSSGHGQGFLGRMIPKGRAPGHSSYPLFRSPSSEPTRTGMSRDQEIQALKRQAHAIEAGLRSLERRAGALRGEDTVSYYRVVVNSDLCVGCGICKDICPAGAISVEEIAVVDSERCTGCQLCLAQCPRGALSLS
jgi:ferredoxin